MTRSLVQSVSYEPYTHTVDPKLDLLLERAVDVSPARVWAAWTRPELLMKWFTPAPWKTVECEIDLRPGGIFRTVMESPEGQRFPGEGCILEAIHERKLVWTSLMLPGFRPAPLTPAPDGKPCDELRMTAVISLSAQGSGTRYSALAMHTDPESCKKHEAMGFESGWGTALDQLVALAKGMTL